MTTEARNRLKGMMIGFSIVAIVDGIGWSILNTHDVLNYILALVMILAALVMVLLRLVSRDLD